MKYRFGDSNKVEEVKKRIVIKDSAAYRAWLAQYIPNENGYPREAMNMRLDDFIADFMPDLNNEAMLVKADEVMRYTPTVREVVEEYLGLLPAGEKPANVFDIITNTVENTIVAEPKVEVEPIEEPEDDYNEYDEPYEDYDVQDEEPDDDGEWDDDDWDEFENDGWDVDEFEDEVGDEDIEDAFAAISSDLYFEVQQMGNERFYELQNEGAKDSLPDRLNEAGFTGWSSAAIEQLAIKIKDWASQWDNASEFLRDVE